MDSLHDLIYGQDNQTQQNQEEEETFDQEDEPSPSRKRTLNEDNNNERNEEQTATTDDPSIIQRMNVLYNQRTVTDLQDFHTSLNPPLVHQTRDTTGKQLTAERRAKQERKKEWQHIRQQWKNRQVNYRNEPDVGGVMERVLKNNNPVENKTKIKQDDQQQEEHPLEVIDTSDEEEEAILRQLSQGNGQSEKRKKRKLLEENERIKKNDVFIPYQDKMNFHDRGLVQPDNLDPLRQYEQQKQAVVQQFTKNWKQYSKHPDGDAITLRRIRVIHRLNPQESTFPPLDHNLYCSPPFAHKRQVLRLAARCLFAREQYSNRVFCQLLRYLWNMDISDATQSNLVRYLARETATRHELFWSRMWKNRGEMAEVLGVTKEMQGPDVGYRLESIGFKAKRKEMLKLKRAQSRGLIAAGGDQKKNSTSRASARKKRSINLLPTVSYAFIPGTTPPVPQHPLDESGVVLGPPDRFCNYITSKVVIDESTWKLTSAHLFAIFAAHVKSNTSTEDISSQIQNMCRKTIDLNRKMAKIASSSTAEDDWPLPHVYRSWMGYLSLILNGLLCLPENSRPYQDSDIKVESDLHIDDSFVDLRTPFSSVRETAAEFFELYQQVHQKTGLERFGDYHLVNSLLRIARDLPESAARLLSQPMDGESERTPFELMDSILVYLDQGGMLTEKPTKYSSKSTSVIELEYAMFQSSEIFLKCVERDSAELKFHCWHLATLASSLLLCSGNRIGSGAFLEPSSGQENGAHMVRQALPKFQETRRDTARALYLLFQLISKQSDQNHIALSSDINLAVSKFLEWHQVVALLIGPDSWKEKIEAVETIHTYHSNTWALSSVKTCQDLSIKAEDRSIRIEAAARALEQDPSCKQNWRVLALELGPVGCRASPVDLMAKRFCVKKDCFDCWILARDCFVDHEDEKRNGESTEWWGLNRKQWWQHCVLDLKDLAPIDFPLLHRIHSQFYNFFDLDHSSITVHQPVTRGVEKEQNTATLDRSYNRLTEVDCVHPEQVDDLMSGPVNQYLPKSFTEMFSQNSDNENSNFALSFACSTVGDNTEHEIVEVECYKIIIASHLHGPGNPWVRSKVLQLATRSWDRKDLSIRKDSAEWAALQWLYQMGISAANAVKIATKIHNRKKSPSESG